MSKLLERIGGLESVAFIGVFLCAGIGWWHVWVSPNDTHLHAVVQCVEDEGSYVGDRGAWERCHNRLVPEAGGLVSVFSPPTE